MPPQASKKNPDWIDWARSESRQIVLKDLDEGTLSLDENSTSAHAAWAARYQEHPKFVSEGVCFSQFKVRLKEHRVQVSKRAKISSQEEAALVHDQLLYPRATHNSRGEPVFGLSLASLLLRQDVKEKKHEGLMPSTFQRSRPEYMLFKPCIFNSRIYQEIRREKFVNHLELQRAMSRSAVLVWALPAHKVSLDDSVVHTISEDRIVEFEGARKGELPV
jgi:hypothetical protein